MNRLASNAPWTCTSCRTQLLRHARFQRPSSQSYSTRLSGCSKRGPRTRAGIVVLTASATGAAGAGVLAFTDDIKYGYDATERTGRVAAALALCINDYRTSLNQREKTDNLEEQDLILKQCHKRCAERTLEVLEKNGGIFIKLGQHLVFSFDPSDRGKC
ncbi:hypothetical protein RRF57_007845 [Xylaria bambusicola]|uniref:Uncharacterized protein n=1 Tax=Xylaria bambusicola TaxID=326684 RepID=A0AAN7USP5_9PEZI